MLQTDLTFDYRFIESSSKESALLLLLHGYGSNEADLFSLAENLCEGYLVASVRAPHTLGTNSYAWYGLKTNANGSAQLDDAQAEACYQKLPHFIDELREKHGIQTEKATVMGFSQGAAISYGLALHHPEKIKRVAAVSGYLNSAYVPREDKDYRDLEIFISHGTGDKVVPFDWGLQSYMLLKHLRVQTEFKRYEGVGHCISQEGFRDLVVFLSRE